MNNCQKDLKKMRQKIKKYIESLDFEHIEIDNDNDVEIIYNLYFNNCMPNINVNTSGTILGEIAFYNGYIKKNVDSMKKYYCMAIDKGDINSMYAFAQYYEEQKDYDNMKKYYLMAIDNGCADAMCDLGLYYEEQKDYDSMKKYLLMAIDKDNAHAMRRLAGYYKGQKDYDNMKKYYTMAIDKGDIYALMDMAHHYEIQSEHKKSLEYYEKASRSADLIESISDKFDIKMYIYMKKLHGKEFKNKDDIKLEEEYDIV